jgi:hypothetical protein
MTVPGKKRANGRLRRGQESFEEDRRASKRTGERATVTAPP